MQNEKRKRSYSECNNVVRNFMSKIWSAMSWFKNEESGEPDRFSLASESQSVVDPLTQPPQAKRKRLNAADNGINLYATSSLQYEDGESDEPCCSYNIPPRSRSNKRKDSNFMSHRLSDEANDSLFDRTPPPAFKREHILSNRTATPVKQTSLYQSIASEKFLTPELTGARKDTFVSEPARKHFRASLLGSPFYVGSTMYGGAASACYQYSPNVQSSKQVTVNKNASTDSSNLASVAVKNLSEVLDISHTIASEANYLPSQSAIKEKRNEIISLDSMPELRVASPARFLNLKRMRGPIKSSSAARQLMASASSSVDMHKSLKTSQSRKFTTKIKPAITKKRAATGFEDEMPAPVKLPNAVLEIDRNTLPILSFTSSTPNVNTQKQGQFIINSPLRCSFDVSTSLGGACNFSFSKPLVEQEDKLPQFLNVAFAKSSRSESNEKSDYLSFKPLENGCVNISAIVSNNLENVTKEKSQGEKCINSDNNTIDTLKTSTSAAVKWKCDSCWVINLSDVASCVCCGESKPITKLAAPITPEPTAAVTWKCSDCWIVNKEDVQNCIACGGNKPSPKTSKSPKKAKPKGKAKAKTKEPSSIKTQPAPNNPVTVSVTNGDWRCDTCLVKNASDITACAACGGKPPTGVAASPAPSKPNTTDAGFINLVKTQTSKWECPCCLVKNDNDRQNCACCDTARPGATKEPEKKKFNFGTSSGTTFKFGIPNNTTNSSDVSCNVIETKQTEEKPVESEKNNNVLPKAPATGFTFGIPKAKDSTDPVAKAEIFSFGLNAAKPVANIDNQSKKEVEQEVPRMPVASVSEAKSAIPTFSFTSKTTTFTPILKPTPSLSSLPKDKVEPAVSVAPAPQTVPSILGDNKLASTNIFGLPIASTAANTIPSLSAIPPAIASTAPVLQAPKTTAANLFSFSSGPAKVIQPSATTAPIFSFGSNTSAQPPATPKFNFTFGGSAAASENPPQNQNTPMFSAPTGNTPMFSLGNSTANTNIMTVPNASHMSNTNPLGAPAPMASNGNIFTAKPTVSGGWPPANSNIRSTFSAPVQPSFSMNATPSNGPATPMFVAPSAVPAPAPTPTFSFGGQENNTPAPSFNFQATPSFGGNHVPMFGATAAPPSNPAPAYNFGAAPTAPSSASFNFGSNSVYTFGTPCAPAGSVHFNMGSGPPATPPNIAGRKFRKAARRNTALR